MGGGLCVYVCVCVCVTAFREQAECVEVLYVRLYNAVLYHYRWALFLSLCTAIVCALRAWV